MYSYSASYMVCMYKTLGTYMCINAIPTSGIDSLNYKKAVYLVLPACRSSYECLNSPVGVRFFVQYILPRRYQGFSMFF